MARIHELLEQVKDPILRKRLEDEVANLLRNKKFGLVFEDHDVERTPLYGISVRSGMPVVRKSGRIDEVWDVLRVEDGKATCRRTTTGEMGTFSIDEIVPVAQLGEPIFPMLQPIDKIENAPDSNTWHTLIEADNYHALQLLEYLYAGKVDCIYIDPPYNTGAKDWKYNNDYVDGSDSYRHSKWLSMMEKRLKIAKRLLNPKDSVLIVTIDEKEYLHLGCLLEELFPEARMQMISSIINFSGVPRNDSFSRTDEYIFFVLIGNSKPQQLNLPDEWLTGKNRSGNTLAWRPIRRNGSNDTRVERPHSFFPIFIDNAITRIVDVGDELPYGQDKNSITVPEGCIAIWPIKPDGTEGCWRIGKEAILDYAAKGYARVNKTKTGSPILSYIAKGEQKKVETGVFTIIGKAENGSIITSQSSDQTFIPGTQWRIPSHNARDYGSTIIRNILSNKRFDFPKSLYAVHDAIRFFVANKPNALIIDFFAGSGTTLHAVNLLNAEDGGHRRCIMVTNNEVSADEAKDLTEQGYQPGDPEWERYGVARYVTWPRTCCAIKGVNVRGEPLKGTYLGTEREMSDGFPANAEYFKLGFLERNRVSLGMQFREILPLLWMKSGAVGKRPVLPDGDELPEMMILPENGFAVLLEEDFFSRFQKALQDTDGIHTVYFVTDSDDAFSEMSTSIDVKQTYQLYRNYIENFALGGRR